MSSPAHFLAKLTHAPYFEKSSQKQWVIYVIFLKLSKVSNRNLDENSPNLVTLTTGLTEKTSFEEIKRGRKKKSFGFQNIYRSKELAEKLCKSAQSKCLHLN
jgi:hypothetical protein